MSTKYILEKIRLDGELHNLLVKTNAENVACTYNGEETTLAAALMSIYQSVGALPTAESVKAMVAAAAEAGGDIANSMYQAPTAAQYRTKGNMTASGTNDITGETLANLMGDNLPDDLTLTINGVTVGTYAGDTLLSDVLSDINSSSAGVEVTYAETTQDFLFTAKRTGAGGKIDIGSGLGEAMFCVPGLGSKSFAEAYGIVWLEDGETEQVTFKLPCGNNTLNISADVTVEEVASQLNAGVIKTFGYTAACNKYTGQLEVTNSSGAVVDLVMTDSYGDGVNFDTDALTDISYTYGLDGIFTAIKVNGEVIEITGKAVNIAVPTKVSDLDNDSNFQTQEQVAAAVAAGVAGAAHLTRKKVTSLDDIDPAEEGAENYIYMVPKSGGKNGDKYDEYMVLDGQVEPVGDWKVDLDGYVEKEEGKGLSTEDFTTERKEKLDGMAPVTEAEKTAWDAKAETTEATTSAAGLMSAADKTRLNGLRGVRYGTEPPEDMQDGELFIRIVSESEAE